MPSQSIEGKWIKIYLARPKRLAIFFLFQNGNSACFRYFCSPKEVRFIFDEHFSHQA